MHVYSFIRKGNKHWMIQNDDHSSNQRLHVPAEYEVSSLGVGERERNRIENRASWPQNLPSYAFYVTSPIVQVNWATWKNSSYRGRKLQIDSTHKQTVNLANAHTLARNRDSWALGASMLNGVRPIHFLPMNLARYRTLVTWCNLMQWSALKVFTFLCETRPIRPQGLQWTESGDYQSVCVLGERQIPK